VLRKFRSKLGRKRHIRSEEGSEGNDEAAELNHQQGIIVVERLNTLWRTPKRLILGRRRHQALQQNLPDEAILYHVVYHFALLRSFKRL
jgi:hypothetical protein